MSIDGVLEQIMSEEPGSNPPSLYRPLAAEERKGPYKKRIVLYGLNKKTGINELALVEAAARMVGVSVELFIRGAVVDTAAQLVLAQARQEQEQTNAPDEQQAEVGVSREAAELEG